jgi:hypothetical protein
MLLLLFTATQAAPDSPSPVAAAAAKEKAWSPAGDTAVDSGCMSALRAPADARLAVTDIDTVMEVYVSVPDAVKP